VVAGGDGDGRRRAWRGGEMWRMGGAWWVVKRGWSVACVLWCACGEGVRWLRCGRGVVGSERRVMDVWWEVVVVGGG
jgi:hypothetical protein